MAAENKWRRLKTLDEVDNLILLLIGMGHGEIGNSELAYITGMGKSTITDRMMKLSAMKLAKSVDVARKQSYRKYVLTEEGEATILSLRMLLNILHLKSSISPNS